MQFPGKSIVCPKVFLADHVRCFVFIGAQFVHWRWQVLAGSHDVLSLRGSVCHVACIGTCGALLGFSHVPAVLENLLSAGPLIGPHRALCGPIKYENVVKSENTGTNLNILGTS